MNATPTTNHPDQSDAPSRGRTLLVDVRQAAEMLSLSRSSIYQLIGTGQLSPIRIGRSVRFSVAHPEHFVAALGTESPKAAEPGRSPRCSVEEVSLLDRVTVDPAVCHGAPTVRGLRYSVEMIVGSLAAGMTTDDVLADYADLEREDVLAALEYAALVTRTRSSVPIPAVPTRSER